MIIFSPTFLGERLGLGEVAIAAHVVKQQHPGLHASQLRRVGGRKLRKADQVDHLGTGRVDREDGSLIPALQEIALKPRG